MQAHTRGHRPSPGLGGRGDNPRLRRRQSPPKIIAISGGFRNEPEDCLTLARLLGADQTLAKPFAPKDLLFLAQALLASAPAKERCDLSCCA